MPSSRSGKNKPDHPPLKLVLASSSPFRRELLSRLGIPFEIASPNIDEEPLPGEAPEFTARRLARQKAIEVGKQNPDALIIGSDQVALLNGKPLTKPGNHANAVKQLTSMRGRRIVFHTALALYNGITEKLQERSVPATVTMRNYSPEQIEHYLTKEQPYNCCGSAKTEGLGIALIARIETEDPNALVGLPLIALTEMLANEGVDVLTWGEAR
jgi:septum formation protein